MFKVQPIRCTMNLQRVKALPILQEFEKQRKSREDKTGVPISIRVVSDVALPATVNLMQLLVMINLNRCLFLRYLSSILAGVVTLGGFKIEK